MGKFNLNQLLNSASNAEGGAGADENRRPPLKVISISIDDLTPSESNFYSVDNVEELKTSIELFGVLQNLTVKPIEGGKYKIIAGHRRFEACKQLVAEGKTEFEYLPCGVQSERDEIKENILLIMTNSTARELSDYEKMKQAEELRKNFELLKKRENLPGRVRDLVAEALNTSSTQIARLNAIENNLNPEFKEEFKSGNIGTSAAYELSGMSEEKQAAAFEEYKEKGGVKVDEIKEQKRQAVQGPPSITNEPDEYPKITRRIDVPPEISDKELLETSEISEAEKPPILEEFPETPSDFSEGEQSEDSEENAPSDFAEMTAEQKAAAAIGFLQSKRFALFAPGEDTRIFDFIIEVIENQRNYSF